MNYFNYFTEIEDAFVRRRGKHLLLSPMDWALIETWKQLGVPLHIALRGIEKSFDSWEAKPRKRTVKSLLYCQEEIEAQFGEWLESRVGTATQNGRERESQPGETENLLFSRDALLDHLRRGRLMVLEACEERKRAREDDLSDALARAAALLQELADDFAASASFDAHKLEDSLTGLEKMLSDAIRLVVSTNQLDASRAEVTEQLRPYRSQMDKAVYQQTLDNLLLKRLREQFAVPRLSLFYL